MRYKLHHQYLIKKQFKQTLKRTKGKTSTPAIDIQYGNNDFGYPRLGVIISKKNIKRATTRNRFKRVIRERFRLNQHKLKPVDIFVFIKRRAEDLTKKELDQQLTEQLKELSL